MIRKGLFNIIIILLLIVLCSCQSGSKYNDYYLIMHNFEKEMTFLSSNNDINNDRIITDKNRYDYLYAECNFTDNEYYIAIYLKDEYIVQIDDSVVLSQKRGFSKYLSAASYNNYEIKYLTLYDLKEINAYEDDMKLIDIIKINEVHFVSTKNNHYLKYAYQTIKFDVKNKDVSYKEIQDVNQKSKYFCRLPSDNYFSYSSFLEIAMPIEEYDDYSIIEINADSQQLLNNFVKVGEDNDFDTLIFVLNECNVEGTKINDLSSIFKENMNIKINYQKFISLYFGVQLFYMQNNL